MSSSSPGGVGTGQPQMQEWQLLQMQANEQSAEITARLQSLSMQLAPFSMNEAELIAYSDVGRGSFLKYQSSPDTPVLIPLRIIANYPELTPDVNTLAEARQYIESQLPPDLLAQLNKELAKPPAMRDPSFVALDDAIQSEAVIYNWIQQATTGTDASVISRGEVNCAIPAIVASNLTNDGQAVLASMRTTLYAMGPNYPGYDSLSQLINETDDTLTTLESL